jgi:hypothetical protein
MHTGRGPASTCSARPALQRRTRGMTSAVPVEDRSQRSLLHSGGSGGGLPGPRDGAARRWSRWRTGADAGTLRDPAEVRVMDRLGRSGQSSDSESRSLSCCTAASGLGQRKAGSRHSPAPTASRVLVRTSDSVGRSRLRSGRKPGQADQDVPLRNGFNPIGAVLQAVENRC